MSNELDAELLLREALSRLLAGDLPPEEADRLRLRIAQEPEVSQAWAELQALCAALEDLPDALSPPPALDAAVLERILSRPPRAPSAWTGRGLGLAAAVLLGVGTVAGGMLGSSSQSPPSLVLVSGEQVVEGAAVALTTAQGERVEVSGRALVRLEPSSGWLRERGQLPTHEEDSMTRYLLSAGAGAALTVVVYEGSARITPAGGTVDDAVTVEAGQQQTFAPLRRSSAAIPTPAASGASAADSTELEAELASLREEVASLRLERDLQSGALKALAGEPQDWPESVPAPFREAAFSENMRALVAGDPSLELLGVDCEEFPCLAIVRDHSGGDAWMNTLRDAVSAQWDGVESLGMGMWISQNDSNEEGQAPVNLAGISIVPPEGQADDVATRTDWRMKGWLEDVSAELAPDEGEH